MLCDRAANLIQSGEQARISKAMGMLKRAKFMAERAYRPSHLLLDSLNSNLAVAIMALPLPDLEHAHDLAKSAVRTGDAMEALTTGVRSQGSRLTRSTLERSGHAKSLAGLAHISVKLEHIKEALDAAHRAHVTLHQASEGVCAAAQHSPIDSARLIMSLASTHWLAAKTLRGPDALQQAQNEFKVAVARLEEGVSLLKAAGLRKTHPDYVVCTINRLVLRRILFSLSIATVSPPAPSVRTMLALSKEHLGEQMQFDKETRTCKANFTLLKERSLSDNQVSSHQC